MKAVTRYQANDGTLFETETEALDHDGFSAFQRWYDQHTLGSGFQEDTGEEIIVEAKDLWGWLKQYKANVIDILNLF